MSSIEPIRPVSGPPPLRPLRRGEREEEGEKQEHREGPGDDREPDDDEDPKLVDIRA